MECVDGADVDVLLGTDLLCAAGQEEGIALFALDLLVTTIRISEEISFGDGSALRVEPPNSFARRGRFPLPVSRRGAGRLPLPPGCVLEVVVALNYDKVFADWKGVQY